MNRKLIITIVAAVVAAIAGIALTADEYGIVCQTLCGQKE